MSGNIKILDDLWEVIQERSSSEIEGLLNSKLAALSAIVEDNDELVNTEDEESTIKTYKDSMH